MPSVRVNSSDSFEVAPRRFEKQFEKDGILSEIVKRAYYEKPSVKRTKQAFAAKKRARKRVRKLGR